MIYRLRKVAIRKQLICYFTSSIYLWIDLIERLYLCIIYSMIEVTPSVYSIFFKILCNITIYRLFLSNLANVSHQLLPFKEERIGFM